MTIVFRVTWGPYSPGDRVNLGSTEEARLIGLGLAVDYSQAAVDAAQNPPGELPTLTAGQFAAPASMPAGVLYLSPAGAVVVRRAGESVWSPVSGDGVMADLGRAPLDVVGFGNSYAASQYSAWEWMCRASGHKLVAKLNAGIGGNTTAQMLARVATDVPAGGYFVPVFEGPNDVAAGVGTATHIANLRQICEVIRGKGDLPAIVATPPRNSFVTATHRYRVAEFLLARELRVPFLNPWGDFLAADGSGSWHSTHSADGIHPLRFTEKAAGELMWQQLMGTAHTPLFALANTPGTGMVTNSLLLTDTNTDGMPDGWIAAGNVTPTRVPSSAGTGKGNWYNLSVSGAAGSTYWGTTLSLTSGFTPGDVLMFVCRFRASGLVNAKVKLAVMYVVGTSVEDAYFSDWTQDIADTPVSYEFTVPAGCTAVQIYLQGAPVSAGSSWTADVGIAQPQIWNLTTAPTA